MKPTRLRQAARHAVSPRRRPAEMASSAPPAPAQHTQPPRDAEAEAQAEAEAEAAQAIETMHQQQCRGGASQLGGPEGLRRVYSQRNTGQ
jgi:hypothetical protein